MFDQLKQLKQLKDLQNKLGQEEAAAEKDGVTVKVNGQMKILEVQLNPDLSQSKQEELIVWCANQAMKEIQSRAAQAIYGK